jgi:aryl-alcohol dehydrogenase-like predicted oxidoreductase
MRFNELGKTGIRVSAVAIGTWAMGGDWWGSVDEKDCIGAIHAGLDGGINIIDTAPAYGWGRAERLVGKAVRGRPRDRIVLATKCGLHENAPRDMSGAAILKEAEISLQNLGTDYIDIYQIHWPDGKTPVEEAMGAVLELKQQGKVRALGVSNFSVPLMKDCLAAGQLDSLQPPYSLLQRDIEAEILPFCRENHIGVLSYGSLGAGMLAGKYSAPPKVEGTERRTTFYPFFTEPLFGKALKLVEALKKIAAGREKPVSHVAINWVSQQPGMTSSLVGCKNPAQARENAAAGDWSLSPEELAEIDRAYHEIYG